MVKHTIHHHTDARLMEVPAQLPEILIAAQTAVDGAVIPGIIAVAV